MPRSAMTAGALASSGASKKCASMARAPSRNARAAVDPRASASGSTPADDVDEYRPPTQFQNSKSRVSESTPQASTSADAVRDAHATKCARTTVASSATAAQPSTIHRRALAALRSVSAVVQDLETTMQSVVVGSRPAVARSNATGSTFATNRTSSGAPSSPGAAAPPQAWVTNSGPRYEPPMPTTTTLWNAAPDAARTAPARTSSTNANRRSRTSHDCSMASSMGTVPRVPSQKSASQSSVTGSQTPTLAASPRCARSAVWSTARRSDVLIRAPRRICAIFRGTSMASASSKSLAMVSADTFWRVQSRNTPVPGASSVIASTRSADSIMSRRCSPSIFLACCWSARYSFVSEKTVGPPWPNSRSPTASAASTSVRPSSVRWDRIPSSISARCRSW
mmetsp:Transcript_33707/g.101799  ORF Transcript_33707/g.101799 Transcript_33707/m.101799 type:complete len:396 (-) Transcript_33707:152-1339(-)